MDSGVFAPHVMRNNNQFPTS